MMAPGKSRNVSSNIKEMQSDHVNEAFVVCIAASDKIRKALYDVKHGAAARMVFIYSAGVGCF